MSHSSTLLFSFEDVAAHSTLTVYNSDMDWPCNRWTERHINQGFSWREGCVAFATLGSMGIDVEVWLADEIEVLPQTERCILIPFVVNQGGEIGVDGSCGSHRLPIPSGPYDLLFENGMHYDRDQTEQDEEFGLRDMWCRLTFIPSQQPRAEILKEVEVKGGEGHILSPSYPLLMEAEPA
jgi:hypothetical protein